MDLQCDQVELRSRSRLKIRRAPSGKISSQSSSSFHESCRQKSKGCNKTQPLIFYTFEPKIIETEPADFMWVVQRLTGSPHMRRSLRKWIPRSKETQSSLQTHDVQLMQQGMHSMQQSNNDPLKEGTTTIIALASFINDLPPSPSRPNPSYYTPELPLSPHANKLICKINEDLPSPLSSHLSNNTCSHPLASPLSSDTKQLNLKTNHPSSPISSNSSIADENTNHPLSPISSSSCAIKNSKKSSQFLPFSHNNPKITQISNPSSSHEIKLQPSSPSSLKPSKCLIIDSHSISLLSPNFSNCGNTTPMSLPLSAKSSHNKYSNLPLISCNCGSTSHLPASPLSAKTSDELGNTRGPPCSAVSLNSSLTTDNLSTQAGPYREALCFQQGNTIEAEEAGNISFFVFSPDSYYGNYVNAAQDEVEFHHSSVLDSFFQSGISTRSFGNFAFPFVFPG